MKSKDFGNYLVHLRKNKDMSQKELAEKLDVSNKTISRWETGVSFPDITYLNKMCEIFDVSLSELIDGNNTENKNLKNLINVSNKNSKRIKIFSIILIIAIIVIFYLILKICFFEVYKSNNMETYLNYIERKSQLEKADSLEVTNTYNYFVGEEKNCSSYYEYYNIKFCEVDEEFSEESYDEIYTLYNGIFYNTSRKILLSNGDVSSKKAIMLVKLPYDDNNYALESNTLTSYSNNKIVEDISIFSSFYKIAKFYDFYKFIGDIEEITYINTYITEDNDKSFLIKYNENQSELILTDILNKDIYVILFANMEDEEIFDFIKNIEVSFPQEIKSYNNIIEFYIDYIRN